MFREIRRSERIETIREKKEDPEFLKIKPEKMTYEEAKKFWDNMFKQAQK